MKHDEKPQCMKHTFIMHKDKDKSCSNCKYRNECNTETLFDIQKWGCNLFKKQDECEEL